MARFRVDYRGHGRSSREIEASSLEEAESIIDAQMEDDNFDIDFDEYDIDHVDIRVMHPVTRNGREVWTTYVMEDDVRGHASELKTAPLFKE